jgi:fatty-acyl-CoA synthase
MKFPQGTIPEALCETAAQGHPRRGFTFVLEDKESFCSFQELATQAARYAAALLRLGVRPGDRVALALPSNDEFVFAFLGAMYAGIVPVPMYPPHSLGQLGSYLERARHILHASEAAVLITSPQIRKVLGSLIGRPLQTVCTVNELGVDESEAPIASLRPEDPAFIQFTSGSTSRPKGVVVTHSNLSSNIYCITHVGLEVTPDDIACAWLPLYHDMGLIGFILAPITASMPVILMSPLLFLKRPVEWLRLITRHRATLSFSPNFGYGLCASRVREQDLESLNLASWRVAGCGAEPIQIATFERFQKKFQPVGFDRKAFLLCYGLAESTLAVSFSRVSTPPQAERIRLNEFSSQKVAWPADPDDSTAVTIANCGRPFPGHELAILDAGGEPCTMRKVGEIVLRGPSVMKGYYNNPEATDAVLQDEWLHTGDLGYLVDGELFVCGRIKELIIVAGRNYHPTDFEWAVSDVPGIRQGRVVAFSVCSPAGGADPERVIVCAETKHKLAQRAELAEAVKARVLEVLGIKVSDVVLLDQGTLPRTSSGKLQRNRTREMYLHQELQTATKNKGRLILLHLLVGSQWGFMKNRLASIVFGGTRS